MTNGDGYRGAPYLFHLTHEKNISGILAEDALLSHGNAHRVRRLVVDVSDSKVQAKRGAKVDPVFGRPLHDYVNLYFRARGPMLFVRRELQASLVVLYVNRDVLHRPGVIFTDGNAASGKTRFFKDQKDLEQLDWECIAAENWTEFQDGKRRRAAEVLVPHRVPLDWIFKAVVQQASLQRKLGQQGWRTPVDVRPDWFF